MTVTIAASCTACGACIATCPPRALQPAPRRPTVIDRRCTDCWACIEVCPVDAITALTPTRDVDGTGLASGTGFVPTIAPIAATSLAGRIGPPAGTDPVNAIDSTEALEGIGRADDTQLVVTVAPVDGARPTAGVGCTDGCGPSGALSPMDDAERDGGASSVGVGRWLGGRGWMS